MQEIVLKGMDKDFRSNEAYKTLRTNIEFSGADNKVIVFTSCTPNEGKSTVSLSVSSSLAEAGKKVLFIDADLRTVSYTHLAGNQTDEAGINGWCGRKYQWHRSPDGSYYRHLLCTF